MLVVPARQYIQQGRFPAPTRPDYGDKLSRLNHPARPLQNVMVLGQVVVEHKFSQERWYPRLCLRLDSEVDVTPLQKEFFILSLGGYKLRF